MSSLVKDRVLKRILMIGTGGTIACKSSEDGLKPLLTSEELLRYVPDTKEFCKVDSLQVINIDSTNMQPRYWLMIAETIENTMKIMMDLWSAMEPIPWLIRRQRFPIWCRIRENLSL